jgi:hypothetical protein
LQIATKEDKWILRAGVPVMLLWRSVACRSILQRYKINSIYKIPFHL